MLSKLFGNRGQNKYPPEDMAFLRELFEVQRSFYGDGSVPTWQVKTPIVRIQIAERNRETPSPADLEWAMEAQIAQEVDSSSRKWTIGDYSVWLTMDESPTVAVERAGKSLKSVPAAVRQAPEYAEVKEAQDLLREQWARVRRRLDLAMVLGEVMDREAFAPALTIPAGRAMVPQLVLRCWLAGANEPVDLRDFRTLDGVAVAPDQIERYQVAHPRQLAESGTLGAWQRRLVELGLSQPALPSGVRHDRSGAGEAE